MSRWTARLCAIAVLPVIACSGGRSGPLVYTDPPDRGALRLVRNDAATARHMLLDLVVGDAALTGYSVGFDLPLDATKVTLGTFSPGTALDPGAEPIAAAATIATEGPLAGMLVVGQSQKAGGAGAVAGDTTLGPGTLLFTIELDVTLPLVEGVVFDGTAKDFVLPSGGLRDRLGLTVVTPGEVQIGRLEVQR
ncbi:MAG TPA: hypothetical protein VFK02_31650 [Kofleriaceae bacterium]|nr:hypothetical protein [Kofleriaceae bacterium]